MNKPVIMGPIASAGLSGRMRCYRHIHNFEGEPFIVVITRKLIEYCGKIILATGLFNRKVLN